MHDDDEPIVEDAEIVPEAEIVEDAEIVEEPAAGGTWRPDPEYADPGAWRPDSPRALPGPKAHRQRPRDWGLLFGFALIVLGAGLFVLIQTGVSVLGTIILVPGVLLLALAIVWHGFYVLVLPGCALTGWGIGMIVDKATGSDMRLSLVGLGLGLVAAYVVRRFQRRWPHWWPLVPAAVFIAWGILAGVHDKWHVVARGWPLAIVTLGVAVVVRVLWRGKKRGGLPARR